MSGTNQSVNITLRNPLEYSDQLTYTINVYDNAIAQDWITALKEILRNGNHLEKNFCFLGFPDTARTLEFLCNELNNAVAVINDFFDDYKIDDVYTPELVRIGLHINHDVMNVLHNHFERLQGTVENLSPYYRQADYETKYAIRQLNNICHELESLVMSLRKKSQSPEWVRSSQITTFLQCTRYLLSDKHRQLFLENSYDRRFGHVYMHWTQIGKTLIEVFRDEHAPKLDATVCEAINSLQYYSGEFDIEWGNSVYRGGPFSWHTEEQTKFHAWLLENNFDPVDPKLSLGYLPLGQVDLTAFGTDDPIKIREILGKHLDIYQIAIDDVAQIYDYCWSDSNYKQQQINRMIPGYDYSSRG